MTYCQKCGTKNEDDAEYCKKCGATLGGPSPKKASDKEWDKRCEDECSGGGRGWAIFWGVIIILVGLFIIFEMVFKNMLGLEIMNQIEFGWIIAAVIGLFIVILGVRILTKR